MEAAGSSERVPPAGRRPWAGRRVVLGVAGGIAAYKSVQLARDLALAGAVVDVVMTDAARAFVGPISFEALTGRPVKTGLIEEGDALVHIRLAREADVVCVAPATADLMARAAAGRADDLLSAILLATRAPVVLCPAMNDAMWAHPATQRNVAWLRDTAGHIIAGPAVGPLAYGEGQGPGRMEEPEVIFEHVGRTLAGDAAFKGRRVVVTSGPTREPVDPVRVLSNRSSGRMGHALALAAWRRGADVTLITGPTPVEPPPVLETIRIETAAGMEAALRETVPAADVLIMAAAVADFRPAAVASGKIRRVDGPSSITLEPVPDLLAATRPLRRDGAVVVGFALETEPGEESARAKLASKGLHMIVLNRTGPGTGFESATNRVTLIADDGSAESLPMLPKEEVAERVLDRVAERLVPAS